MPLAGELHRMVWGGPLATTEEWSVGIHYVSAPDTLQLALGPLKDAVVAWIGRGTTLLSEAAKLEYVKSNHVSRATGKYLDPNGSNALFFAPISGAVGNGIGHPQTTLAVSTHTALSRGRGSKGRFYPPTGPITVDATGHVVSGLPAGIAASAVTLINALNTAYGGRCSVFSLAQQNAESITSIRVGNVVDTQQRRRKSLIEAYTSTAIA